MAIKLPAVKISYLLNMTDDTGLFQHARFSVPKREEGYTIDDNARALIACTMYQRLKKDQDPKVESLANVYLAFLNYMQKSDGSFHNFLSYRRTFLDSDGSLDSKGRTLNSLGCVVNSTFPKHLKMAAKDIFERGLLWIWESRSLRFSAQALLGLSQCFQASREKVFAENAGKLADRFVEKYRKEAKDDWRWFESILTYDIARLPQALFEAYNLTGEQKYLDIAEESMDFLLKIQMLNDVYVPIGNKGWYRRGQQRAVYDQQPLEAAAMVDAAACAYYATHDKDYVKVAHKAFEWFLGGNTRNEMLYCPETGGCFDGLCSDGVNFNQGAESSVSYLTARLKLEELRLADRGRKT